MNRWLLRLPWLVAALFVVVALSWLSRDPRVPHEAFQDYSIYNSSPKGLSLASHYLESSGRSVRPLVRSVDRAGLPADAVLFRVRPGSDGKPGQAAASSGPGLYPFTPEEDEWVRGGGRLVLAIDRNYGGVETRTGVGGSPRKVFPAFPGVEKLEPAPSRGLGGWSLREAIAIVAGDEAPVLSLARRGKGDIVLCSIPEIFQNGKLAQADHLGLLLQLAGSARPVFFDEFAHGLDRGTGIFEILARWGFGPFLVIVLIAWLVSFWRRRVRVGPEEEDVRETRTEAVDFVDSLALLYSRMLPRRHLLSLYSRAFEQTAAAKLGLRGPELEARIREYLPDLLTRAAKGKDLGAGDFHRDLDAINHAFRRLNDAKHPGRGRKDVAGAGRP
jgi:hypothetical protein